MIEENVLNTIHVLQPCSDRFQYAAMSRPVEAEPKPSDEAEDESASKEATGILRSRDGQKSSRRIGRR